MAWCFVVFLCLTPKPAYAAETGENVASEKLHFNRNWLGTTLLPFFSLFSLFSLSSLFSPLVLFLFLITTPSICFQRCWIYNISGSE